MHSTPLLKGVPVQWGEHTIEEEGEKKIGPEEVSRMLTDYVIQAQAMSMVMGLIDDDDGWDGPKYVAEHVYAMDYMVGSNFIYDLTAWDEQKAFNLMSLSLPKEGERESAEQNQAREIVEACLQESFSLKLAYGLLIVRVFGEMLGTLWRHDGSDTVPGTYAHWFRHGTSYWNHDEIPPPLQR